MNIRTTPVYPPIPVRTSDWFCYDDDSYCGCGDCHPITGTGATEEEAVLAFVADLLDRMNISVTEIMSHRCTSDCRRDGCDEVEARQRKADLLS